MQSIVAKTLKDQDIVLDHETTYVNCKFVQCRIVYLGGDNPLINCSWENTQFTLAGEAAKTLAFMQIIGMMTPVPPPQIPPAVAQLPESGNVH